MRPGDGNMTPTTRGVDADGSGVIDYTEFLAATLDRHVSFNRAVTPCYVCSDWCHRQQYMKEDVCWAAFRVFDRNGDGHISTQELKQAGQINNVLFCWGNLIQADFHPNHWTHADKKAFTIFYCRLFDRVAKLVSQLICWAQEIYILYKNPCFMLLSAWQRLLVTASATILKENKQTW